MIKLYDLAGAEDDRRFSPYCWRTKMALKHKGLEFETVPWRFTEKERIAHANATTVPVIEDGGTKVADSWNVAIYLDQAYPQRPGLMDGTGAVAMTMFLNQWALRTVHAALFPVIVLDIYARIHEKDKAYFRESREKRFGMTMEQYAGDPKKRLADFRGSLEPLRPVLVQHKFISGHGPGYADYIVFGALQWARVMSPIRLLEPDDPMFAWRERMLDLFDGFARSAKGFPVWA